MSRASRPLRRVRGADIERLVASLPDWIRRVMASVQSGASAWFAEESRWKGIAAERGCRPAQLRRAALGLPVSARAAARILRARA